MTRDEIMRMPAGREMDLLICETFDLRVPLRGVGSEDAFYGFYSPSEADRLTQPLDVPQRITYYRAEWDEVKRHLHHVSIHHSLPRYSIDMAAAWEVLGHTTNAHWVFDVRVMPGGEAVTVIRDPIDLALVTPPMTAETAPLAICRTALLAPLTAALSPDPSAVPSAASDGRSRGTGDPRKPESR